MLHPLYCLVACGWLSFFIDPAAAPARIGVTAISFLAILNFIGQVIASDCFRVLLPPSSPSSTSAHRRVVWSGLVWQLTGRLPRISGTMWLLSLLKISQVCLDIQQYPMLPHDLP